jgi:hypothetical protein
MKNTIYFIAGILFTALISAGTISVMTVKPATPRHTIVVSGWTTYEINYNMKPYIQKGYVVKNLAVGDGFRVVVMEKY